MRSTAYINEDADKDGLPLDKVEPLQDVREALGRKRHKELYESRKKSAEQLERTLELAGMFPKSNARLQEALKAVAEAKSFLVE